MSGLFILALYVMLLTLNPYTPTYQDRLTSPDYNETHQNESNRHCPSGSYYIQKDFRGPHHTKYACIFTREMLGNCSGLEDPTYGYPEGKPCFLIKMNRIINFLPGKDGSPPYVKCTMLEGSSSNLDHVEYYPVNGTFDISYFPYYGSLAQKDFRGPHHTKYACIFTREMLGNCSGLEDPTYGYPEGKPCFLIKMNRPNYTNPLVAVKFNSIKKSEEIKIECKVVADHICTDNFHDPYEGKVVFQLKIES
ncbi:UNVERIFIED_CONTAM: hypothetical protein FKN15_075227 [Acipenser sinensis]